MTTRSPRRKAHEPAAGKIGAEIRQSRPFTSVEQEAAVTLLRTGDVLRHAIETALRPWGVSPEQYNVLRILRGADAEGLPTLEIAERMLARSPNITRLVDKMVEKRLAERRAMPGDRRVVRVLATDEGRRHLADLDGAVESMISKLSSIDPAKLWGLVKLLDAVRERLAMPTAREGAALRRKG
jgi:DNA-binding MarR family transcriptional regulator